MVIVTQQIKILATQKGLSKLEPPQPKETILGIKNLHSNFSYKAGRLYYLSIGSAG